MDFVMQDAYQFFDGHQKVVPIFEIFVKKLFEQFPQTVMKVQKTQITFSNCHVYACVSFMRVRKKAEMPDSYFIISLGLSYPLESERVAVKTEAYPGRWTTHIVISALTDLDEELFCWVQKAYDFAVSK